MKIITRQRFKIKILIPSMLSSIKLYKPIKIIIILYLVITLYNFNAYKQKLSTTLF